MKSSPPKEQFFVAPVAGVKRPAPSLLPAFEPSSSSPSLPRPTKRVARVSPSPSNHESRKYPTPVPTSSTGILSSSPPPTRSTRRQGLTRTLSALSERTPLSSVPSIELDRHGEPTLMGRSTNSTHHQLSSNKLISRVHLRAVYVPPDPPAPKKIEVVCMGWNGAKIHCQGRTWELKKDDTYTTEAEDADVMIDIQDTRVLLQWPKQEIKISTPVDSDSPWEDENSPRHTGPISRQSPYQSPLRRQHRFQSPVSPTPVVPAAIAPASALLSPATSRTDPIQVYEDDNSGDEIEKSQSTTAREAQSTQQMSQPLGSGSQESQANVPSSPCPFSDCDEENDPIINSFGPFGANLMPRMESFTTSSPGRRAPLQSIKESSISPQKRRSSPDPVRDHNTNPVVNHVINQLAYSRLSSTPLSTLMEHLPSYLKADSPGSQENFCLDMEALKTLLNTTKCIGEVQREGKDAAGKRLESEFYYIPELDLDDQRRDAVVEGLRKPGLRACRKQHKVRSSHLRLLVI